jgi:hypothetical protein
MKKELKIEKFAALCFHAVEKLSEEFTPIMMAKENSPFKDINKEVFINERFVLVFWVINKFFAPTVKEGDLMNHIYTFYFSHLGILNNEEEIRNKLEFFSNRFEEYDGAFINNIRDLNSDSFMFISSVIGKNIFQKDKPILNINIMMHISLELQNMIIFIGASIFDKYRVEN